MKGYEKIKELIEGELESYGHFEIGELKLNNEYTNPENDEGIEYYIIDIKIGYEEKYKTLRFNYDREKDKMGIVLNPESDTYEEIENFDWTIKYFWMAILEW